VSLSLLAIAPHGAHALPALVPEGGHSRPVADALAEVRRRAEALSVETWVVITPHGIRIEGGITLSATEWAGGFLPSRAQPLGGRFPVDLELVAAVFDEAKGLPLLPVSFGASETPLDWGVLIPLAAVAAEGARVVVACPSEAAGFPNLLAFGACLGAAAERHGRSVAVVASADLCHTHSAEGPYGHHPEAAALDAEIVSRLSEPDWTPLYRLPAWRLAAGKPDGLAAIACLDGARQVAPFRAVLVVYDRPSYYGMAVALFHREPR
jgi:aromatic ring-opening dioxygenase LigB subunit